MPKTIVLRSLRTAMWLLLVVSLLVQPSREECGEGCLSCAENVETGDISCKICDLHNSYVKAFDGTCEQNEVENCEVASLDRFTTPCLQCQPNYVLDIVQGKCVSVNVGKVIPDCHRYTNLLTCSSCVAGHYISFGKCIKTETEVKDCVHYSNEGICSECVLDKFLDKDLNECRDFPKAAGCLQYNLLRCDQCKAGFAKDLNFYLRQSLSDSSIQSMGVEDVNFSQVSQAKDENCFPLNVPNCMVHETADSCLKCDSGYFVTTDRKCEEFPENRISNCKVYTNKTTCKECEFLYRLSGNECVRRDLITDCVKYEIEDPDCIECVTGKYTNGSSCLNRTGEFPGCKTLNPEADNCSECEENYLLTSQSKCVAKLANCKVQGLTYGNSSFGMCTTCNDGYFMAGGGPSTVCHKTEYQPNCKERVENSNSCEECSEGYFKESGKCKVYTVDFCQSRIETKDECNECIEGFKKTEGICRPVELNNCVKPSTVEGQCLECVEGFFLDSNKLCRMRNLVGCASPTDEKNECDDCAPGYFKEGNLCYQAHIPNCKDGQITKAGCGDCESGYYINEFKTCSKQLDKTSECGANSNGVCTSCSNSNTHYLEPISRYCLERDNTSGCTGYDLNADLCTSCDSNKFLLGGKCVPTTVSCNSHKDFANECESCNADEYLDPVTKTCLKNILNNCTDKSDNSGFGCKKCNDGYYLNPQTKLCEMGFLPHCSEYESDVECKTCEEDSYILNGRCYKNWQLGCFKYKTVSNTHHTQALCEICYKGFYDDNGICKIVNIANCAEYTNNTCKTCNEGYHPSSDKFSCVKNFLPNCVEYTYDSSLKCTKCENLYFEDSDICKKITKSNCVESEGNDDICLVCEPGYKKSGPSCVSITTHKFNVQNCKGNDTTDDVTCSVCEANFKIMMMTKVLAVLPPNCVEVDRDDPLLCNQCAEFYELESSTKKVCKLGANLNSCIQVKSGETTSLENATATKHCAKCINYDDYYLSSFECKPRTNRVIGCSEYDETSDACKICSKPFNKIGVDNKIYQCKPGTLTPNNKCDVYDIASPNSATCEICKLGSINSASICDGTTKLDVPQNFWSLNIGGMYIGFSTLSDYSKVTVGTNSSGKQIVGKIPEAGKIHIIDFSALYFSPYNAISNKIEYNSHNLVSVKTATVATTASWYNTTPISQCKMAYFEYQGMTPTTNYVCFACESTHYPKTSKLGSQTEHYVSECLTASSAGLLKNFDGMGYLGDDFLTGKSSVLNQNKSFATFVNFDSCSNGGNLVVYFLSESRMSNVLFPINYNSKPNSMECLTKMHEDNYIDNCQVYGYVNTDPNVIPDVIFTKEERVKCLACKPGYAGSNFGETDFSGLAGTCTAIPNCDMNPSVNTKMNYCGKCKLGYAYEFSNDTQTTYMHRCISAPIKCKVYNPTYQRCVLCKSDYMLNENLECVLPEEVNCDKKGIEINYFKHTGLHSSTDVSKLNGIFSTFFLAMTLTSNKISLHCHECKSGMFQFKKASNSDKNICYYDKSDELEGCDVYKYSATKKCSTCKDGYLLKTDDDTCLKISDYTNMENCAKTVNANLNKQICDECREGYSRNNDTKKCEENPNCKLQSSGLCTECTKGNYLDRPTKICRPNPIESECDQIQYFGPERSGILCEVCKDKSKVPVNYFEDSKVVFECIPDIFKIKNIYNPVIFDMTSVQISSIYTSAENQIYDANDQKITHFTDSGKYLSLDRVCAPLRSSQQNCKNYDYSSNNCTKCFDGYVLVNNICQKGGIVDCLEYSDQYTCSKCAWTHFLKNVTTFSILNPTRVYCEPYTKFCDVYVPNKDECQSCPAFHYLDGSNECKKYTVDDCQVFFPNDNLCSVCSPGFVLNSSNTCDAITVANCATYSSNKDQCVNCREGFYLAKTSKCMPHTVWNCQVYSTHKDSCDLCMQGFYLDENGQCHENFLVGCEIPKDNENKCSLCAEGYWLNIEKSTCHPYTVRHCARFNILSDKCISCDSSSYWSSNGKCVEYSAALNCDTFHPSKDECISCVDGFYLADSKQCKMYTINSCKTYNLTKNECTSCLNSFYLDVENDSSCKPITAMNCAEYSVSENRCSLCFNSNYLDIGSGDCKFYSVQNCQQYHPYKDLCSTCQKGHYLNADSNCVEYSASGCSSFSVNSDKCVSCRNGFYLNVATQECISYTAKHCVSFRMQQDRCSSCLPGFYLNNGKCLLYTVSNCAKNVATADRCNGCTPGHYFSAGKCLKYTAENCKDFSLDSDKCNNCLPGHFFEYGHCFEYSAKNCKSFKEDKDLCQECDNSSKRIFRNDENKFCEEVTEVENCKTYSTTKDECTDCEDNFYLKDQVCLENPTGIPKCEIYSDQETCVQCEAGSYLMNNACVLPEIEIHGCTRYSSEKNCEVCSNGYSLSKDFQCEVNIETSCASHVDTLNCASCSGNKVLQENSENNIVCVNSNINFCSEAVNSSGVIICTKCQTGYFLNEAQTQCLWPETLVQNCLNYSDHGVCSRCEDNFLLSKDNSKCTNDIATVGMNCMVGHVSDKPKCSRCDGGFYFNDSGVCQQCSDNIEGCRLCDINNLSRCLICKKNFFMKDDFTCEEYPPPDDIPIGVGILRLAFMSFAALIILLK